MPSFMIFGLAIWGLVTLAGLFIRWLLGLSALTLLAFMAILIMTDGTNTSLFPYNGEISVVDIYIKSSRYGRTMPFRVEKNVNWLSLTIRNTDEREHPATLAVCSFRSPVYYDPNYFPAWWDMPSGHHPAIGNFVSKTETEADHKADKTYLGDRRMVVRLVAVASTKIAGDRNMLPPVVASADRRFVWSAPRPTEREIAYLLAFPKLRLFADDVVEWCKFGKTLADLPQDRLEPRVEWIGAHADIPIEHVALDPEAAVLAGR